MAGHAPPDAAPDPLQNGGEAAAAAPHAARRVPEVRRAVGAALHAHRPREGVAALRPLGRDLRHEPRRQQPLRPGHVPAPPRAACLHQRHLADEGARRAVAVVAAEVGPSEVHRMEVVVDRQGHGAERVAEELRGGRRGR